MSNQASIREEELKNRVAMLHFGKYDCTRIVGNFTSGDSPAHAAPIDRNNFTYIYRRVVVVSSIAVFLGTVASAASIRPVLPPVQHLDTEVVTNVAISAAAQGSREYAFELLFPGTESNNVEIAFGADADGDGALSVDEIGLSAGWDCGEWFVINAATGERVAASAAEGTHSLVGTIRLRTGGRVREISFGDGSATLLPAIQSAARSWAFPAAWNMVRLVGRGENVRSGEQFHVSATSHGLMFRLH